MLMEIASSLPKSLKFLPVCLFHSGGRSLFHSKVESAVLKAGRRDRPVARMRSSKAGDEWLEDGVLCRLYDSGVLKFGVNLGWPKSMEKTTKRTLTKDAVTAVRTHKAHT